MIDDAREHEPEEEPLRALLFAVDTGAIDHEPIGHYIETIATSDDPRAVSAIERLIARALDDLEQQPTEEADRFARNAGHLVAAEMDLRIDPDLRRRAAQLGIQW